MLVRESRALFGAIALLTTGAILSSMTHQYFAGQYTGEAIVRSRSWWEVVLNLQVLCLAFMWFCYADRVRVDDRKRAFIMRLRMAFGLMSVSVPFLIAIAAAYLGWFEERPSIQVIDIIVCYMLIFWAVSACLPRMVAYRAVKGQFTAIELWRYLKPRPLYAATPAASGGLLILADFFWETRGYYFLLPTLFYLQAAMPFLIKAFGRERPAVATG